MAPVQSPEIQDKTPFDHGDQLDFHKGNPEHTPYKELLDARNATDLAYEATSNSHASGVGKGAVASSIDSSPQQSADINQALSPLENAQIITSNIPAMRKNYLKNING